LKSPPLIPSFIKGARGILGIFLSPTLQRKEQIKEIKECKTYNKKMLEG